MSEPAKRNYGVIPVETIKSMSGLELMRKIRDGELPFAPISEAMDYWLDTVEPGFIAFVGRPNLAPSSEEEFGTRRDGLKYVDSDDIGPRVLRDPGASAPAAAAN